jgi:hypothetical protein
MNTVFWLGTFQGKPGYGTAAVKPGFKQFEDVDKATKFAEMLKTRGHYQSRNVSCVTINFGNN